MLLFHPGVGVCGASQGVEGLCSRWADELGCVAVWEYGDEHDRG